MNCVQEPPDYGGISSIKNHSMLNILKPCHRPIGWWFLTEMKIYKSDYIKYSRFIVKKLHKTTCYGTGSMYEENVVTGLPNKEIAKKVLEALVKQRIVCKKKKEHGWKYHLNMDRYDKIKEIIKEIGSQSIIPILLMI